MRWLHGNKTKRLQAMRRGAVTWHLVTILKEILLHAN
jgi:hypothetical protein